MSYLRLKSLGRAACIFALVSVTSCGTVQAPIDPVSDDHGDYSADATVDDAATASFVKLAGDQFLLSINSAQQIVLNNLTRPSRYTVVSDIADDGNTKRLYPNSAVDGENLHVAWMEKNTKPRAKKERTGEKYIVHASVSSNGTFASTPHRISSGGGAFIPVIKTSGDGKVYVVWTDERRGGKYDIFINASKDGGQTWMQQEFNLTNDDHPFVVDPAVELVGNAVVVAWVQQKDKNTFSVLSRTSEDFGATWADPRTVYEDSNQPITPKLIYTQEGLNACWAMSTGVACAGSKDKGDTWSQWKLVEGTERTGLLTAKSDSTGKIHLITNQRSEEGKSAALFYTNGSAFRGFSKVSPISRQPLFTAKSIAPTLAIGPKNEIMVAWMDYFYMKPLIAAAASMDGGSTWQKPYIISYFGNTNHQYFPSITMEAENTFDLAYLSVGTSKNSWTTLRGAVDAPKSSYDPKIDIRDLKTRAQQYWETRVKAEWTKSYDFMDPYYRKAVQREAYVQTQGRVNYYGFEFKGEPTLNGVKATVPIEYESEVPEFMLQGKMVKVPKQKTVYQQPWVWMDGQWYVVFEDVMGNSTLPE